MSFTEIISEVASLSSDERAELMRVLKEAETQDKTVSDSKPFKTAFDIAPDVMKNLVGSIDSGITDLGSNKVHLEGLGTKQAEKENSK